MQLLRPNIIDVSLFAMRTFCQTFGVDPHRLNDRAHVLPRVPTEHLDRWSDALDFYITAAVARQAQTFIFDSAQIMAFLAAVDRTLAPGDYQPPFPCMIVQFTQPIPEFDFLSGVRNSGLPPEAGDSVAGLVMGFPEEERTQVTMSAWYTSLATNRAVMEADGDGLLSAHTVSGQAMTEAAARDKQRILNLGMLCIAYINSPGIEVEHVAADLVVNRKRAAKGKRELPDYYVCRVRHERHVSVGEGQGTGRHVSFRFDVRGHMRRLPDGRMVWIRSHQRGVEHELYKPKAYRVD
jgi:hypothetical protein